MDVTAGTTPQVRIRQVTPVKPAAECLATGSESSMNGSCLHYGQECRACGVHPLEVRVEDAQVCVHRVSCTHLSLWRERRPGWSGLRRQWGEDEGTEAESTSSKRSSPVTRSREVGRRLEEDVGPNGSQAIS